MSTEFSTPINNLQVSSTDIIQDIQNELDAKNNINDSIHERTLDTNTNILPLSATTIQDIESSNVNKTTDVNKIDMNNYNENNVNEDLDEDIEEEMDDDNESSYEEKTEKSMLDYTMDFLSDVKNFSKLVVLFVSIGVMFYYLNTYALGKYYANISVIVKYPIIKVILDNVIKATLFIFFMKYIT
jgi:hypothetical protein